MNNLDTSPEAVAFLRDQHAASCYENGDHKYEVDTPYSLGADAIGRVTALSAQLASVTTERDTARSHREALIIMADKAHATGRAEGLREAVAVCELVKAEAKSYQLPQLALGASKCIEDLTSLIAADTPAAAHWSETPLGDLIGGKE